MKGPYTVEQQDKVYGLTQKIAFFSWRLGGGVEAVEVLDQKNSGGY